MDSNRNKGIMPKETDCKVTNVKVENLEGRFNDSQDRLNGNLERLWTAHTDLMKENKVEHKEIISRYDEQTKKSTSIVNAALITILSSIVVGLMVRVLT